MTMARPKLHDIVPESVFQKFLVLQAKARVISDVLRSREHILYQSHMRAYTTLLSHILASNPDIAGYVELHRSYRHPADLVIMRQQVRALSGPGIAGSRYTLDKLLHNGNGVSAEVGRSDDVKSVFALRLPEDTLPSIVEMVRRTGESVMYATPEGAAKYYVNRVQRLANEAANTDQSFYFDAETIVDDPDRLLSALTGFLGLSTDLSTEYETFEQTGQEGSGDPSKNIQSGTIVRDRERPNVDFPEDLIQQATDAYHLAREALLVACSHTVTSTEVSE